MEENGEPKKEVEDLLKQVKKNIALRKNVGRLERQFGNKEGKGAGDIELRDLDESGKEIDPDKVGEGFSQNLNKDSFRREDLMNETEFTNNDREPISLKDLLSEEKSSKEKQKEKKTAVSKLAEKGKKIAEKASGLAGTMAGIGGGIQTAKEFITGKEDSKLGKFNGKLTTGTKRLKIASQLFAIMGIADKHAESKAEFKDTYDLVDTSTKMAKAILGELNSYYKNAAEMTEDAALKEMYENKAKEFSNAGLNRTTSIFSIADAIIGINDSANKFSNLSKLKKDIKEYQQNGFVKDIAEKAADKRMVAQLNVAFDSRKHQLTNDQIDQGFKIAENVANIGTNTISFVSTFGVGEAVNKVSSAIGLKVPIASKIASGVTKYIKKAIHDDKDIYIKDIFGNKDNYDKIRNAYGLTEENFDREMLQQLNMASISEVADKARAEQAMQIVSNADKKLGVNTVKYSEKTKLSDEASKVYKELGGSGRIKEAVKVVNRKGVSLGM